MTVIEEIRARLRAMTPGQLEAFRKKLEHGQQGWTPDQYAELIAVRPELEVRACGILGLPTEAARAAQATVESAKDQTRILWLTVVGIGVAALALLAQLAR